MPRQRRIQFPGAVYYVTNRERHKTAIFFDEPERADFIETLARSSAKAAWKVLAFVLTQNRYHLLIATPEPNLVAGLRWLLGCHGLQLRQHRPQPGHLFGGRYRSVLVDGASPAYLRRAWLFTLLRAVSDGPLESKLMDNPWSSLRFCTMDPMERPGWIHLDPIWAAFELPESRESAEHLVGRLEALRRSGDRMDEPELRRGWLFGPPAFKSAMMTLQQAARNGPASGARRPPLDFDAARAEAIVQEELKHTGWTDTLLQETVKNHPRKVAIAARVRAETTASLRWVAARLNMGSWTHTANSIYMAGGPHRKERQRTVDPVRRGQAAVLAPATTPAADQIKVSDDTNRSSPVANLLEELPTHCL
jgi:REP element-mobilizing transposase RayT